MSNTPQPQNFIQPAAKSSKIPIGKFTHPVANQNGAPLLGMFAAFGIFKLLFGEGSSKNKIASGYWGGAKETSTANKKATQTN